MKTTVFVLGQYILKNPRRHVCPRLLILKSSAVNSTKSKHKPSSWQTRLIVEEMSQHAHRHIVHIEQTFESEGENLVMRGELRATRRFTPWLSVRRLVISALCGRVALLSLSLVLLSYYF